MQNFVKAESDRILIRIKIMVLVNADLSLF